MSVTFDDSQGLTNQLNGYNETGSSSATPNDSTGSTNKTDPKSTTKNSTGSTSAKAKASNASKTPKAQEDTSYYYKGSGESHTETITASTSTPSPDYHQDQNNVDFSSYLFWPVLLFLLILFTLYRLLKSYAQKNPAHGGFAHKHKHLHPGVPEPKILKR